MSSKNPHAQKNGLLVKLIFLGNEFSELSTDYSVLLLNCSQEIQQDTSERLVESSLKVKSTNNVVAEEQGVPIFPLTETDI